MLLLCIILVASKPPTAPSLAYPPSRVTLALALSLALSLLTQKVLTASLERRTPWVLARCRLCWLGIHSLHMFCASLCQVFCVNLCVETFSQAEACHQEVHHCSGWLWHRELHNGAQDLISSRGFPGGPVGRGAEPPPSPLHAATCQPKAKYNKRQITKK